MGQLPVELQRLCLDPIKASSSRISMNRYATALNFVKKSTHAHTHARWDLPPLLHVERFIQDNFSLCRLISRTSQRG